MKMFFMSMVKTVQPVTDKVFKEMLVRRYQLGPEYYDLITGYAYPVRIQPIMIDGQLLAMGHHKEFYVSHFLLFSVDDRFKIKTTPDVVIYKITAGKISGMYGASEVFENLVWYESKGQVTALQNPLHACRVVKDIFDVIVKRKGIQQYQQQFSIDEIPSLQPYSIEASASQQ